MKRLFKGSTQIQTIQNVQSCEIPKDIKEFNTDITDKLTNIINKSLEKDLNKRYETAQEFEFEIRQYLNKYHPNFNISELSTILKETMHNRMIVHQKLIKKTLLNENKPKKAKNHLNNIEFKDILNVKNVNINKTNKIYFIISALLVFLILLIFSLNIRNKKLKLTIFSNPKRMVLVLNNKKINKYIKSPIKINLNPGKHIIKFKREGYYSKKIDFNLKKDMSHLIKLKPKFKFIKSYIKLINGQKAVININKGRNVTKVPSIIKDLIPGYVYNMQVFYNKDSFLCKFKTPINKNLFNIFINLYDEKCFYKT